MNYKSSSYCFFLLSLCFFSTLSAAAGILPAPVDARAVSVPDLSGINAAAPEVGDAEEEAFAEAEKPNDIPERKPIANSSDIDFKQIDLDYDIGRFEEALWALEDLQKVYPNSADVLYRLGLLQEEMFDFDAAIKAYEMALRNKLADAAPVYKRLGDLYYQKKKNQPAITAFEGLVKLKPESAYASYMLGTLYMNTGKFLTAIEFYGRSGEQEESYKQNALYGQGVTYISMGQSGKGKALLNACIALDPESKMAGHAKLRLAEVIVLENQSYFTFFGMYGYQYDSNVILKPSASANVPLITGVTDFEHTFLLATNYAPPPNDGLGYKLQTRAYANIHDRLRTFDIIDLGLTYSPYISLTDKNILSLDTSFDYIFFNYSRYMDFIGVMPTLTYSYSDQLQLTVSSKVTRENYYQPALLFSGLQDGWIFREDMKIKLFSKDHLSSMGLSGHYTTALKRGTDWSYRAFGVESGFDVALPFVKKLTAGLHATFERQKYMNWVTGNTAKRRDNIINASISLGYQFTHVNVSLTGNYTHDVSTIEVYSYVRMMAGFNISGSF